MLDRKCLAYAQYRLEVARKCLGTAVHTIEDGDFAASANRSYYCIFHAMRAVLALDSLDFKKHSGVIAAFRQRYIKTGVFPAEFSEYIKMAFVARGKSDYEDFFVISKADVAIQIENARVFLDAVTQYLTGLEQQGDIGG